MNEGFAMATGDIVLFLDSDDLLNTNAVSTLLSQWQPDTVLAQYPLKIVDQDGTTVLGIHPDPPSSLSQGDVRGELLKTGSFGVNVTSGLAFSRLALASVMPMPADEFWDAADATSCARRDSSDTYSGWTRPWGPDGSMAGTIQRCLRPLADWPKDCARRFDGRNVS